MSKHEVKKAPKKKNGYKMPDPIPNGEILQDMAKKKWCLGPSIGIGGFGEIYSAAEYSENNKKISNYPYVVKIEPYENGPLFVEMHFYIRNAKSDDVEAFRSKKKLTTLGMPCYIGSGSHECNGTKYRFIVMQRFGKDIWKLFLENKRCFPTATVLKIGIQLLDILQYIHSKGYVHADIKGANALLGLSKSTQNQVYLVDFGLAGHYTTKDYKVDPRKAHNGTIEYTSRDAHAGVLTRRGDLEILSYNLIQWLGCTLPWETNLTDPVAVQNSKLKHMSNVNEFLKTCFGKKVAPNAVKEFVSYVSKMDYDTEPDYEKCRSILVSGLEAAGGSLKGPLEFTNKPKTPTKRRSDRIEEKTPDKKRKITVTKKVKGSGNITVNKVGEKRLINKLVVDSDNDNEILEKKENETPDKNVSTNGYTAEMLRVKKKIEEAKLAKLRTKKLVLKSTSSSSSSKKSSTDMSESDNIIDETPPQKHKKSIKKVNKPETVGVSSKRRRAKNNSPVYLESD